MMLDSFSKVLFERVQWSLKDRKFYLNDSFELRAWYRCFYFYFQSFKNITYSLNVVSNTPNYVFYLNMGSKFSHQVLFVNGNENFESAKKLAIKIDRLIDRRSIIYVRSGLTWWSGHFFTNYNVHLGFSYSLNECVNIWSEASFYAKRVLFKKASCCK